MNKKENSITIDEVIEKYKLLYPTTNTGKKTVLTQKDITRFEKVWKKEFISYRGRYRKKHTDTKKETEYKNCLFRIFFKHWDEADGFQINMENVGEIIGKSYITVHRMILFFLKTGIINRCHNYYVGKQTYFYHKNSELFNYLYKSKCNDYYTWILNNKNNINNNINNNSNVFTNKKRKTVTEPNKRGRKPKIYTENYKLLSKIEKEFSPIIEKLNRKQHEKLQINFGLRFNKNGNYTGRTSSSFCYTLNEDKKHTFDTTMIPRSLFMKNVGLTGYKQVYDIKSEVPRTTILSNTGIWKPDSYDFYTEVVKESQPLEVTREKIKELYMRFNFDTGTDKELFNHYKRSRKFSIGHEYGLKYNEASKLYDLRLDNDEEYTFDEWVLLKNVINKLQGKSWGNLIFWWTSLIQIKTIYETLKDTGIRIYNVYDGFYSPREITKKYLVTTVKQSADYIYNKYIKKTPYPY
jgi:predicted transcriptional regulator